MLHNTETQDLSPLELFWHEQNQKLIANDAFLNEFGDLFDDTLFFKHYGSGKTTLNFSDFELDHIVVEYPATLTLSGKKYPLTLKEYAKLLVINTITPLSILSALPTYTMIKHVSAFLNMSKERRLTPENIELFHISFLTQSVTDTRWITRLSPPSYNGTYNMFQLQNIRRALFSLGVEGIFDVRLTNALINRSLDNACQSIMAITRAEYMQGGSFNTLTLEMGQYYVDHLKRIYEQDYFFALVCQSSIQKLFLQAGYFNKVNVKKRLHSVCETILGTFIRGQSRTAPFARNNVNTFLTSELFLQYQKQFDRVQSLRQVNLISLVNSLGLNLRFDAIEVMRVLMLQRYYPFPSKKSANDVWQDYLRSLDQSEIENKALIEYTSDDIYNMMDAIISTYRLTQAQFHPALNHWAKTLINNQSNITFRELKVQLDRVCHAMTSLLVAYTGYRKSEFGFPLSAVSMHPNLDILDGAHVPFRFILKWFVPKTGGSTKFTREITSQCYQIAAQLNDILEAPEGAPCLYADKLTKKSGKKTPFTSGYFIDFRVKANWTHFVNFYQPFVDVRKIVLLSSLHSDALSKTELALLKDLRQQYDLTSARGQHLLAASKETLDGLKRLEVTTFAYNRRQKHFKQSLIEFSETGQVSDEQHSFIITECLSEATQQWIRSEGFHLDLKAMIDINDEINRDVRYPTAHAFRHIWAESVLMRYQGDIGAVVQHQFCHLDPSFFMAYLRNKEAKHLMQAARMKVLNSIVDTLLCDTDKIGKEYVGGFSLFVKKAASLVEAVSDNEVRALRDRIAGRVISIQPSRFATCVPREGAESRAKCAEMGEINPHNAKPSFCLGCTNAIITSGNIAGIWATIQPFVKECLNDDIMGFMVESHLDTLHSANKRIKELAPSVKNSSMDKILFYIDEAIKSVERKLEAEEGLYE